MLTTLKNTQKKKFWELELQGAEQLVRSSKLDPFWGLDQGYRCKVKVFADEKKAIADSEKKIESMRGKGFVDVEPGQERATRTDVDMFFAKTNDLFMVRRMKAEGFEFSQSNMNDFLSGGSLDVVRELASWGNEIPPAGLNQAVLSGDLGLVTFMLDRGIDVNTAEGYGDTALMLAAQKNKGKLLSLLLERGADVNAKNRRGVTALGHAAAEGAAGIFKPLLDAGADIDAVDLEGRTPLRIALEWSTKSKEKKAEKLLDACRALLALGATAEGELESDLELAGVTVS